MTIELWVLLTLGFYIMLLGYIPGIAKLRDNQLIATGNFNRDNLKPLTGKGARAQRAIDNLFENLPAFIIVTLLVHLTDSYNEMTQWGAVLFLIGRLLHPAFYILGRPFLRTGSYAIATAGIILMAVQLGG